MNEVSNNRNRFRYTTEVEYRPADSHPSNPRWRGRFDVLSAVAAAPTVDEGRRACLRGLDVHLGYAHSVFHLGPPPDREPALAARGVFHGIPAATRRAYEERFRSDDVFTLRAARRMLSTRGVVQLDDLRPLLDSTALRYLERFLLRHDVVQQTTAWLDTGLPVGGYLSVVEFTGERRLRAATEDLDSLRRPVADVLARLVPATIDAELTRRERDVLELARTGRSNDEIARTLHIGIETVKKHLTHIYRKLGVAGRAQALARSSGWRAPSG